MSDNLITKRAIVDALKELTQTKTFDKISVKDISLQCGINRQTFYYHFEDKFILLKWIYEHDIEDYKAAGITPEMLQNNKKHWRFDLTEDAQRALDAKINQYTGSYPQ